MNFLAPIGRVFLAFLEGIGRITLFTATATSHCFRPPWYPQLILRQIIDIGYFSLPVLGLTALFTGMVMGLQSYHALVKFGAEGALGTLVTLTLVRELGPVLTAMHDYG